MSDLKSQIFTLVKKCPVCAGIDKTSAYIQYNNNGKRYSININAKQSYDVENRPDYYIDFYIDEDECHYFKEIPLTEKEFMELKWTVEEWALAFELKAFDQFKDFAEPDEPSAMDDLLND